MKKTQKQVRKKVKPARAGFIRPKAADEAVAVRFIRVVVAAARVFEDERRALHWLLRPHAAFKGRTPFGLISTAAGTREVVQELGRIEDGVF